MSKLIKREQFIPYSLPTIGQEEIDEVSDSLRSGWVTTGPKVKRFEEQFADYVAASNAVAVNSCTAGLHLALAALGVGPGDEVILPTYTFCSTANVVVHLGGTPILVDIGDDYNLRVDAVRNAITSRTKALIPVHYGGQACDLDGIYSLGEEFSLPIVEDAAHAVGSSYKGKMIGADDLLMNHPGLMRIAVFSFYATKNMTTGEGGMITTTDQEIAEIIRVLTLHGMSRDAWKRYTSAGSWFYEVVDAGYKYNMTDIQAAMGIHQLKKLDEFITRRQEIAAQYDAAFSEIPEITTPDRHTERDHIHHIYPIQIDVDRLRINRSEFIDQLRQCNIGCSVHFIPVHLHPFYQERFGYKPGDFPGAEAIYRKVLSLPIYPRLEEEEVEYIIHVVKELVQSNRAGNHV